MSLSDCQKCWDTPCTCGWDYRFWNIERLNKQIKMLDMLRLWKSHNPNFNFSKFGEKETENDKELMKFLYENRYIKDNLHSSCVQCNFNKYGVCNGNELGECPEWLRFSNL